MSGQSVPTTEESEPMTATYALDLNLVVELRPEASDSSEPPTAVLLVAQREVSRTTVSPGRFALTSAEDVLMEELPRLFRRWLGVDAR